MNSLALRKRDLLMESAINRQVLELEILQVRQKLSHLRGGLLHSRWKYIAPLAGVLVAWKFRKAGRFLKSGVGLLVLRKLLEAILSWSKGGKSPVHR